MAGRRRTKPNTVAERNRGRADWGAHAARANGTRVVPSANGEGASATKLPPSADTALKLLSDIKQHRIDPADLTRQQRRACLMLVAHGSQTSTELAALFKVSPSCIRMDLKALREERGREVRQWTMAEVLGQLALTAEKCTAKAMAQEDPGLAWTIQRDLAKMLKEFGVVEPDQSDAQGFEVTIRSIGQGYDKAHEALKLALNPNLTGEVIDVEAREKVTPALPLSSALIGAEPADEPPMRDHDLEPL